MNDVELKEMATELAKKVIITDGHIDLPYRIQGVGELIDVSQLTQEGDFDYPRATAGGLNAPFMSIYIPSTYQETGGGKELADTLINMVREITLRYPEHFALAFSTSDIERNMEEGLISLPMGMENGAPIEEDLANVKYFYDQGIRYITLTHATDNMISDSSYDTTQTWGGLSEFGELVVAEMNRVGIMVDISHVSDKAFYRVMEVTRAPAIASHSSCRNFTPGFERNMSDDMIVELAENGGVIQINFGTSFLDGEIVELNRPDSEKLNELLTAQGLASYDAAARPIVDKFRQEHPYTFATVQHVAAHIDHVVQLVGIDHVGLGSDFDGLGDTLPEGLKDVSQYPNLIYELLKMGYSEQDIEKVCYKNVFRVWDEVDRIAKEMQSS